MSEFKGTPGPWAGKDVGICKQDDAGLQLGFISTNCEQRRVECAANAMLIAKAPELLDLVQRANGKNGCHTVAWQEKAKEVLAKVLGQ